MMFCNAGLLGSNIHTCTRAINKYIQPCDNSRPCRFEIVTQKLIVLHDGMGVSQSNIGVPVWSATGTIRNGVDKSDGIAARSSRPMRGTCHGPAAALITSFPLFFPPHHLTCAPRSLEAGVENITQRRARRACVLLRGPRACTLADACMAVRN
jgi:hypothetical protein